MAFLFQRRGPDDRDWKIINSLYLAVLGSGALVDSDNHAVQICANLDGNAASPAMIRLEISAASFEAIAQAMLDAAPERATRAFGKALVMGPRRPLYDEDGRELG